MTSSEPAQTIAGPPISSTGSGFEVTFTDLVAEHPVEIVSVKKYSVVSKGFTVGFASAETKPAGTDTQLSEPTDHCKQVTDFLLPPPVMN